MVHRRTPRAVASFLLLAAALVAHAQTAVSSTLVLGAAAQADVPDGSTTTDTFTTGQGATLDPLDGSVNAVDGSANGDTTTVHAHLRADWASAGQGTVALTNVGWELAIGSTSANLNDRVTGMPVWTYTFVAAEDGELRADYSVVPTGDPFGLEGIALTWSGPGGDLDLRNPLTPAASGTFVRSVVAGSQYTFGIRSGGSIGSGSFGVQIASYDANVGWRVVPVPEPASFAALGLGALAFFRRRRA